MKLILGTILVAVTGFAQATFTLAIGGESSVSVTLSAQAVATANLLIPGISAPGVQATTLAANVLITDTTFTLTSATGVTTGMGVLIGSEVSLVTGISGNALTVTRHTVGTSAAAYSSLTPVSFLRSGGYSVFVANLVTDAIRNAMTSFPGPTIQTASTTIASTVAAAVTHVP